GHIVANISSYFLEHRLLRGVLDSPEELLFVDEPAVAPRPRLRERLASPQWWLSWLKIWSWGGWFFPRGLRRALFPIYFKPFPGQTSERVLKKSATEGFDKPGRALFFHCHAIVKRDKTTYDRLTSFLNLYGFCRNITMAALIAAVVLV